MMAPTPAYMLRDDLPANAPLFDAEGCFDTLLNTMGGQAIDLRAALLPDAADDLRAGGPEIGLHHVDARGGVARLERVEIRQADEVFVPVLLRRFFTETCVDRAQAARHLVLEVDGVVDDVQIGVRAPGPDGFVVHLPRAFNGFVAHGVAEVVGKLRTLGAGEKKRYCRSRNMSSPLICSRPSAVSADPARFFLS